VSALDRIKRNLDLLRGWAETGKPRPFVDEGHEFSIERPMRESEIQAIESEFGVTLPPEYRLFIERLGNPRVGPGNKFRRAAEGLTVSSRRPFPLQKPLLGSCSPSHQGLTHERQWKELRLLIDKWNKIPTNDGVITISDYGCAMYGVLVLNGPYRGKVWMQTGDAAYYGPFGGAEVLHDESEPSAWTPTNEPRDYSFFDWYEHWLNGRLKIAGFIPS
jgi:SMI1 / KNR4 family (SUKH-1)